LKPAGIAPTGKMLLMSHDPSELFRQAKLQLDQALELNREFQTYLQAFGDAQLIAKVILEQLA
jgi:hypothetical protein